LWWKEARVFWPLWLALGLAAALVQWLLLWFKVDQARVGLLIVLGPSWAILYAFAVGAGVFSAEREANTQVFLDTLPVGRGMLWTHKVLFALATTLGLALALTALGAGGTAAYDPNAFPLAVLTVGHGVMLFEAIVWSLLWSLVLGSALQAAIAGIFTVGVLWSVLSATMTWSNPVIVPPHVGAHVALAAVAA
jgi:ABC-type transport system involved in multi-copper enzyme maturation permease subunit